jgi:hypothetical protein
VLEFIQRLSSGLDAKTLSIHQPIVSQFTANSQAEIASEKKQSDNGKIIILNDRRLGSASLLNYLEKRKSRGHCRALLPGNCLPFLNSKKHTMIGFRNSPGCYELRNENYMGSNSPKEVTFLDNRTQDVAVFEGFFSFLSFSPSIKNSCKKITPLQSLSR